MKIKLRHVRDPGDIENERVVMHVGETTNIGHYLLGDTEFQEDGTVLAFLRGVYWFPDKEVAAGDFVILHSKPGAIKEGTNKAKTTNHHFYWGLEGPVWTKSERGPVLFEAPGWMTIRVHPVPGEQSKPSV
jgi:hypothetical protein